MENAKATREVVIAVDKSSGSVAAFQWALDNVLRSTDKATALFVQQNGYYEAYPTLDAADYFGDLGTYVPEEKMVELEKKARAEGAKVLEKFLAMAAKRDVKCQGEVVTGDPRDKIVEVLEHNKADCLVVGCRGLGAVKRTFIGSVSDFCAHHSPCPVFIVRSEDTSKLSDKVASVDQASQRKVLVSVDGSDRSAYAFAWALQNLLRADDKVHLATVVEYVPVMQPIAGFGTEVGVAEAFVLDQVSAKQLDDKHMDAAQAMLDRYCQAAAPFKIACETRVLKGEVRDRICEEAERIAADILIVGCRGMGAIRRALLGSTSDYAAHHSPCPLLIVRSPEKIAPSDLPEVLRGKATEAAA